MTRYYGHPIQVHCAADEGERAERRPQRFTWRERTLVVADLLGAWRLRDRWWAAPSAGEWAPTAQASTQQASDRYYYRLACVGGLQCDVYYDVTCDQWILDRVYD